MNLIAGRAVALSLLAAAASFATDAEYLYDEDRAPIFARAAVIDPPDGLAKTSSDARDRARCLRFLESLDPASAFAILGMEREKAITHFRIRRLEGGLPVFGSESRVILTDGDGNPEARFLGRFRNSPAPLRSPIPVLQPAEAYSRAWGHVTGDPAHVPSPIDPLFAGDPSPLESRAELVWFPAESGHRLAWHLAVRPNFLEAWELLVDAGDGSLLLKLPIHCAAGPATASATDLKGARRTFGTWLGSDSRYYLIDAGLAMFDAARSVFPDRTVGALVTLDLANTRPNNATYSHLTSADNTWSNPAAVSAHWHASVAYGYYLRVHGRNSIKGNGGTVRSFINVAGPDGLGMDNAYWNGHSMFYGNGNVLMTSMSGSLDVSGHELTHGVVEASANLRYRGQSGAINESMADIFGAMMDRDDWLIGEDVVKLAWFKSGALRDMANPNQGMPKGENGWQPAHMDEYQNLPLTEAGDYGGVHANSGIPNRAFYLFATRVGKDKAEQVYYRALTRYLNPSSQFVDLRVAVAQAARDLYGATEVQAAADAFTAVGIKAPTGTVPKANVLPAIAGPQAVLLTRAGPGDGNTLYAANAAFADPKPLSRTPLRSRPSVSDDGSLALFVSRDGRLIRIRTDPLDPRETVVDGNPVWAAAAISKDGKRWAAVKIARDTAIHVGDFAGGETRRFPLFRPTGLGVRTAVYASSLDWNHSGEHVLFDAYYRMRGTNGSSMEYWDATLLQVWDRQAGRFGEGLGFRPFGDLPDGASVANPTFSKNSPSIVAYEYIDPDGSISLMARDLDIRQVGKLAGTAMIGFPSFDRDDAWLAFTARNGEDTVISRIPLGPDKLSASGPPGVVVTGFKWPVVFARGKRPDGTVETGKGVPAVRELLSARFSASPRILEVQFELAEAAKIRLSLFDVDGRLQQTLVESRPTGENRVSWALPADGAASGLLFLRLEADGRILCAKVLVGK